MRVVGGVIDGGAQLHSLMGVVMAAFVIWYQYGIRNMGVVSRYG